MRNWLNILALGIWLVAAWPCMGEDTSKVFEIGHESQLMLVDSPHYFIEPVSEPMSVEKLIKYHDWKSISERKFIGHHEGGNRRIVLEFLLKVNSPDRIYFQYANFSPTNSSRLVVLDDNGHEIETKALEDIMPLFYTTMPKGRFRIFFIIEPRFLSGSQTRITVYNEEFQLRDRFRKQLIYGLIYGMGFAFVFYNFAMFILNRKLYLIFYSTYSSSVLFQLAAGSGHIAIGFIPVWSLVALVNVLSAILMSSSILNMNHFNPKLLRTSFIIAGISALMHALSFVSDGLAPISNVGTLLGMSCYGICVYCAILRMQKGYIPATFLAIGWAVLFVGYGLNTLALFFIDMPNLIFSAWIAYALESMLFAIALSYRTKDSEQRAVEDKLHALSQLQKVVYPHQMEQIKSGFELEGTMPTTSGHACVISFDIIGSSKIKHIRSKEFFRNVFTRCNAIMAEGYDGVHLKASAYRVKEMGDGFLCSVGYPFEAMSVNPANAAIDLAKRFAQVLAEEAPMLNSRTPIACGIGIALDTLTGFYPEAGTKEYDIYGQALVLATRYEGMRKTLFEAEKGRSVLIIQSVVYDSLDPSHREGFIELDIKEMEIVVRDDPAATHLFYQFLDSKEAVEAKPGTVLKAV